MTWPETHLWIRIVLVVVCQVFCDTLNVLKLGLFWCLKDNGKRESKCIFWSNQPRRTFDFFAMQMLDFIHRASFTLATWQVKTKTDGPSKGNSRATEALRDVTLGLDNLTASRRLLAPDPAAQLRLWPASSSECRIARTIRL